MWAGGKGAAPARRSLQQRVQVRQQRFGAAGERREARAAPRSAQRALRRLGSVSAYDSRGHYAPLRALGVELELARVLSTLYRRHARGAAALAEAHGADGHKA